MGIFDSIRKVVRGAGKIFGSVMNTSSKIFGGIKKGKSIINDVYNAVKSVPLVGGVISNVIEDVPVPIVGKSIKDIAGIGNKVLGTAEGVNNDLLRINKMIGNKVK